MGSLLQGARLRLKVRAQELYAAGATKDQAYFLALEESWKDEVAENARLWDQAEEIVHMRRTLEAIRQNARSYHGDEDGKGRALNVIGMWADDALAGRLHPSVERITDA